MPTDLPLGYHRLRARSGDTEASAHLIVSPAWLGLPERADRKRQWGFATQLYSVRSGGSWGLGDLADLTDLAVWSASELGADFVLVNPLHAAEPLAPIEPSPYLPSSRRFFNPIYLRVERIPEYAALPQHERDAVDQLVGQLPPWLTPQDPVDRDASWTAKRAALRIVHAAPRSAGRELDYAAYRKREGDALTDFATWNVLAEDHGNDVREWPADYRRHDSPVVQAFARDHADRVDFECWLQWVLDEQLQQAQAKAEGAGMSLGVMHDLAVGVHPGGADAWRLQDVYAQGVQVGAPPDPYNQLGQDWSQPPWRPDRLAELGYQPFRDLIGAVLRHAGGVRVDHIIGHVPAVVDPHRPTGRRGHLRPLRPRRADRRARPRGAPRRRRRGRRGPRRRGPGGPRLPARPRHPRHLDPVVRARRPTAVRCPPSTGASGAWPRSPPTTSRPRPATSAGDQVRLQHQLGLLEGDLDDELASARAAGRGAGWRRYADAACSTTATTSSRPCTATSRSPRRGCSASRSPTRSATGVPRTSRAPPTSTPTGGSRWPGRTAYRSRSRRSSPRSARRALAGPAHRPDRPQAA